MKHCVAGEPLGIGGSLDVRNPAVVVFWGTALSAPITLLGLATSLERHRPQALRILGPIFALGGLSEPAFWGRRPCPLLGRVLLVAHVVLASALAFGPVGTDELTPASMESTHPNPRSPSHTLPGRLRSLIQAVASASKFS